MRRVRHFANALRSLGSQCGLKYYVADKVLSSLGRDDSVYKLSPPQSAYPIYLRPGTSDRDVFRQVFIEEEYSIIPEIGNEVKTIIDCGANIGITTAYLATLFPKAHIFAIEPDPGNFSILQKNTRAFSDRACCINTGIWSHRVGLKIERGSYRDGREWTTRVRPVRGKEEADLQAMSIGDVMETYDVHSIDFLKIDIEGSEVPLFEQGYEDWLPRVNTMAIELHGSEAENTLGRALSDISVSFNSMTSGETTVLIRN